MSEIKLLLNQKINIIIENNKSSEAAKLKQKLIFQEQLNSVLQQMTEQTVKQTLLEINNEVLTH